MLLQGTVKGSSSTDIYLGAFNIPQGSVTVTAGGQILQENTDYIIDYNLGTLKIINQAIINSGFRLVFRLKIMQHSVFSSAAF